MTQRETEETIGWIPIKVFEGYLKDPTPLHIEGLKQNRPREIWSEAVNGTADPSTTLVAGQSCKGAERGRQATADFRS